MQDSLAGQFPVDIPLENSRPSLAQLSCLGILTGWPPAHIDQKTRLGQPTIVFQVQTGVARKQAFHRFGKHLFK